MKKIICWISFIVLLLQINAISCVNAEDLPVTSPFGWRNDPYTGAWKFHAGVDLGYELDSQIPALFDGVVSSAGNFSDGYGNQVLLYHPQIDAYTRYAHCDVIYVNTDEQVSAGEIIALVGSTGRSTGPHLHLEYIIRSEDGGYEYTDPLILWQ